ncbi:hypothetical protein AK812_SmicGene19752 [Symbiodinium microadriaticum]|uniref:Uncharacterized protein n=1 Tax=Symbiodinium microadriaticum TaxID=2951 RepID=A0A1Q9DRV3_SYMMI|nr:hypothetical protein AK812_SmicGene19752 [Symbiodinium microadriaticum]
MAVQKVFLKTSLWKQRNSGPERFKLWATVTPPPSGRSRKMSTSDKVAPIQLSFEKKSTETAGRLKRVLSNDVTEKLRSSGSVEKMRASKGKKPATDLSAGASQRPQILSAAARKSYKEKGDDREEGHRGGSRYVGGEKGIKSGETVLLEEPAAEANEAKAATKPETSPADQPKASDRPTKTASKRKAGRK